MEDAMDYVACPTCRGNGTHVNPAVDGNGLTSDDIDEMGGDDFMEDYLGGVYDVVCEECGGLRVVPKCPKCDRPVVDGSMFSWDGLELRPFSGCYEHLTEDERKAVDEDEALEAEIRAEQRMGA